MSDDPYAVLGVAAGATGEEIAEAYRALAQIYHPDRYADAPARVQAEANKRMQALNDAFQRARTGARPSKAASRFGSQAAPRPAEPPARGPAPERPAFVHYVDGAKGYHNGAVAPLGFYLQGGGSQRRPGMKQCSKLDGELRRWFELQRTNASLSAQQLYQSWTVEEQERYAATLGCSQVVHEDARKLGVPCGECRP